LVLKGHKRGVWDVAFSPTERVLASVSSDKKVKLWNIDDGICINTLEGHETTILRVLWLKHGLQLATVSTDGLLKVWNIKKSECVNTFEEHEGKIWSFDIKDDQIITGGTDSLFLKWRDVTVDKEREDVEEDMERVKNEQALSNMFVYKQYKEAALLAFKLVRTRDFFRAMQDLLDLSEGKRKLFGKGEGALDPIEAVLQDKKDFERQIEGIYESKSTSKESNDFRNVVDEISKKDISKLLSIVKDLNTNQAHARLAHEIVAVVLSLYKFGDMVKMSNKSIGQKKKKKQKSDEKSKGKERSI